MSPFNQPKGMVAYGDMKVMLKLLNLILLFIYGHVFKISFQKNFGKNIHFGQMDIS